MNRKYIGIAALSIIITMSIIFCCCRSKKKNKPIVLDEDANPIGSIDSISLDDTPQPDIKYRAINGSEASRTDTFNNELSAKFIK